MDAVTLSAEQRDLARHALGLPNRTRQSYRNRFVTGAGTSDHPHWMRMVEAGTARRFKGSEITGGDDFFILTRSGAAAALETGERLDPEDFPN